MQTSGKRTKSRAKIVQTSGKRTKSRRIFGRLARVQPVLAKQSVQTSGKRTKSRRIFGRLDRVKPVFSPDIMFAPTSRRTSEPLPAIHGEEPFFTVSRPIIPVSRPVNSVSATENPISRPADSDTASQNHSATLRSVHRYRRQNLTRHQLHHPTGRAHRPRRHYGRQQRGHARRPSHDSGGRQSGQIHQEDRNEKGGINPPQTFPARSGRVTAPSPEAETTASGLGLLRMKQMYKKIRRCEHTLNYIMRNASPAYFCAASRNASHARCRFD